MQHVKWLKLFIYSVNLPWLTQPPAFVQGQNRIATKIAYVYPKILPLPIEFYTDMSVVPVTNSMSAVEYNKDLLQAGGGRGRRICPKCGEAISWGNLSHHIRVKHNSTEYKCKICLFPFKRPEYLREHKCKRWGLNRAYYKFKDK